MRIISVINIARQYLLLGIIGAVIAISLFLIGYFLVYKKLRKGTKKLKVSKIVLWAIFLIYIIIVLGATIGDRVSGYESVNLHLFSSYKEAYNSFSLGEWRNIILNILMFVPMGFMMPLLFKKCEKYYITYLIGFGATLLIETLQFVSKRGIFELDDIINNTLGCIIGYGIVMIFISILKKHKASTTIMYQIPLIVTIIAFSVIFITYSNQELGNLSCRNIYNVEMSKIDVSTKLNLDNNSQQAYVYEATIGNKEDAINLANGIFSKVDTKIDESQSDEYDETIVFRSEDSNYSLWVYYTGLTTWYTDFNQFATEGKENLTYEEVASLLSGFDIDLPKEADFEDNGKGSYSISLNMAKSGDVYLDGELTCTIGDNNVIYDFMNSIISYKPYKEYEILSLKEAYDKILNGEFRLYDELEDNSTVEVTDISLTYQLDSKGFYQPVYDVILKINGNINNISIPALK